MTNFSYDSDLIGGSLQVRECRVIASLLLVNACKDEWTKAILHDNRLQKRSQATARRIAQSLRKRLERLEPDFWRVLRDGDDELATQIALVAALQRNLLMVEFVETVVKPAYLAHTERLESYHWEEFLEERTQRDPNISQWTEGSKKKMGQVLYRMLAEAGYLVSTRRPELARVIVRAEVRDLLEQHHKQRLLDCLLVSKQWSVKASA